MTVKTLLSLNMHEAIDSIYPVGQTTTWVEHHWVPLQSSRHSTYTQVSRVQGILSCDRLNLLWIAVIDSEGFYEAIIPTSEQDSSWASAPVSTVCTIRLLYL
jgi:hypothetical protein